MAILNFRKVTLIFGIIFSLIGISELYDYLKFKTDGRIVNGIISQRRTYWDGNEMISYDYKYKVDNTVYENSNRYKMQYDNRYQAGDSIKIIYLKSKPQNSSIYAFWEFDILAFWPLFVGLLLVMFGLMKWKKNR